MPRVDEYYHAEFGAIEFGRNEGIRRGEPEGPLVDGDARGDLAWWRPLHSHENPFQAHFVLESTSDFRLILRLENALIRVRDKKMEAGAIHR
jgi:hypothetical protein